jgi:hypothetical protein
MLRKKKKPKRDSGTRSRVRKGPVRDEKHLEKVRECGCLAGGNHCVPLIHAHHVRLGLRTMGVRKSDYLTVPLCDWHHRLLHEVYGSEQKFWDGHLIDPKNWIRAFSPEGRKAIAELRGGI